MSRNLDFGLTSQQPYRTLQGVNRSNDQDCGRPWWEWTLLGVTFLNIGCFFGFTIIDILETVSNSQVAEEMAVTIGLDPVTIDDATEFGNPSFTFDLIALTAAVLAPGLLIYGIRVEKKYEILLSPVILSIAIIFCIPEIILNGILWQKIARLTACGFLTLISWPLTIKTVSENTWLEFTITGTSDRLLGMYRQLRYFTALLKLDCFIIMILGVFCIRNGLQSQTDFIFTACLWLYALSCLIIGNIGVNCEIKSLVFTFIGLGAPLPLWITYEVLRFHCFLPDHCHNNTVLVAFGAIATGVLASILKIYVWTELLKVFKNFGFGLTDTAFVGLVTSESSSLLGRPRRRF